GKLEIEQKGANDPVTAADHAANRAILAVLGRERPDDRVLSEESPPPTDGGAEGRLWVVDPLDGTKEFIARNGEFSVMVGLATDGAAALGAVFQPAIDCVFAGVVGEGAWALSASGDDWSAETLRVAPDAPLRTPIRFVRSRSHPDERLARLAAELGEIDEVISGSVGIKCALVARDAADLYVHPVPYLKEWDTCAPEAVLRGAGGRVTDCSGSPLSYGDPDPRQRGGIFAATPAAWEHARERVREITRPMFVGRERAPGEETQ
ncbi:MAG: 3'(2'),5'-bisphosphate nucleotidase CysQ, partial [Gemmatimonadetes bacterium]|nr:3'(2'),5'-bisphosphate nucleotidase CysQ [Gemmatimonadota bacterium]